MTLGQDIKYSFPYFGPFLIQSKISDEAFDYIQSIYQSQRKEEYAFNSFLAGKIEEEYSFNKEQILNINEYIKPYLDLYVDVLCSRWHGKEYINIDKNCLDFVPDSTWVNIQKSREYNPIHNHSGHISWVTYIDIDEEMYYEKDKAVSSPPGSITFYSGNSGTRLYGANKTEYYEK